MVEDKSLEGMAVTRPAISVLVPIYRVEAYLHRCVESVLVQDFTDWELILVDDGSPDACPAICDDYAARDRRIRVVHQPNGGLISARRTGVREARGRYLMFLDSDDWLAAGALAALYRFMADDPECDMVRGVAQRVTADGRILPLESYRIEEGIVSGPVDWLVALYTGRVAPYLWGALYRAELFSDATFDESISRRISLGEDLVTNLIVGLELRRAIYSNVLVYNYFSNPESIMATSLVSRDYGSRLETYLHDRVFVHYPELLQWQQAKFAAYCFRNCFIPEVGFSDEYDHYVSYLDDEAMAAKVRECIEPRFLRFVKCKPLFRAYARLYRMLLVCLRPGRYSRRRLN